MCSSFPLEAYHSMIPVCGPVGQRCIQAIYISPSQIQRSSIGISPVEVRSRGGSITRRGSVAVATWEQARRHPSRQFPQGAPQGRRVDATSIQISLIRGLSRNYVPSYLEALNLQLLHQLPVVDHHGLNSSVNRFGMICGSDKISTKNYADILFPTGDLMVGTILAGATVM